jgi:hypothetical protein
LQFEACANSLQEPISKIIRAKRTIEHLLCKDKTFSLNPSPTKKERERKGSSPHFPTLFTKLSRELHQRLTELQTDRLPPASLDIYYKRERAALAFIFEQVGVCWAVTFKLEQASEPPGGDH